MALRSLRPLLRLALAAALLPPLPAQTHPKVPAARHFAAAFDPVAALPAPPAPGSPVATAELELSLQVQGWRSPDMVALARKVDTGTVWDFSEVLGAGFTAKALPVTARLLAQLGEDISGTTQAAKEHFARKRPPFVDPRIQPCVKVSDSGSYPSGHATQIFTQALVLAELFPAHRTALLDLARRSAWTRIIAGAHFPTDVEGGRIFSEALLKVLLADPAFRKGLQEARAELHGAGLDRAA